MKRIIQFFFSLSSFTRPLVWNARTRTSFTIAIYHFYRNLYPIPPARNALARNEHVRNADPHRRPRECAPGHLPLGPLLFLVLFGATSLLCFFRLVRTYRTPMRLLLTFARIQIFELVRVAFIVRLMDIANYRAVGNGTGTFNMTLLIVEQILLSIGYLMPASTLVKLAGYYSNRNKSGDVTGGTKKNITRVMELALMVAIVLGIVAGTNVSKAQTDATAAQSVKTERTISAVIVTVVLALLVLFCARVSRSKGSPASTSAWLGGTNLVLIVVPIFRLYSIGHPPADSNSTGAKAAFFILQVSVEWLVGASLLAIDAKAWCGIQDVRYTSTYQDEKAHKLAYASGSYYLG